MEMTQAKEKALATSLFRICIRELPPNTRRVQIKKILPRVPYVPRWPGAVQGHAVNTARRFYRQLSTYHEFEDLLQEAYIVFMKCKHVYCKKGDWENNPKLFMALFSKALVNRFLNLVKSSPRYSFLGDIQDLDLEALQTQVNGTNHNEGHMHVVVSQLPGHIGKMIQVVMNQQSNNNNHLKMYLQKALAK